MGLIEPGSESLGASAAGTLDPAFRLMLQTRSALNIQAAAPVLEADLIGSAYFHDVDPLPMRSGALDAVMDQIDAMEPVHSMCELPGYMNQLPHALHDIFRRSLAQGDWLTVEEGVRVLGLHLRSSTVEQNGGKIYLVEMDPGSSVGRHRHLGEEYTLVLKGSIAAENEVPIPAGSLVLRSNGSVHMPEATGDELCAMLVIMTGGVEYVPDQISA